MRQQRGRDNDSNDSGNELGRGRLPRFPAGNLPQRIGHQQQHSIVVKVDAQEQHRSEQNRRSSLAGSGVRPHPQGQRRKHDINGVRPCFESFAGKRAGGESERNQSMQAVGEAAGAIEGDEESGHHRQSGRQPYGDFTVSEQLVEHSDNQVVERRQRVCAVAERSQNGSPNQAAAPCVR